MLDNLIFKYPFTTLSSVLCLSITNLIILMYFAPSSVSWVSFKHKIIILKVHTDYILPKEFNSCVWLLIANAYPTIFIILFVLWSILFRQIFFFLCFPFLILDNIIVIFCYIFHSTLERDTHIFCIPRLFLICI